MKLLMVRINWSAFVVLFSVVLSFELLKASHRFYRWLLVSDGCNSRNHTKSKNYTLSMQVDRSRKPGCIARNFSTCSPSFLIVLLGSLSVSFLAFRSASDVDHERAV